MKTVRATAPSNIALIKYMGKSDPGQNKASNPSFSYTLPHLQSLVQISSSSKGLDQWQAFNQGDWRSMTLSASGQKKFLGHVQRLKNLWSFDEPLLIESANNFPADCGIASSASSFAALTKAMALYFDRPETDLELARLSRLGSGSSCRSFFGPWCLWNNDLIEAIDLPLKSLLHSVILVDQGKKEVSSSEAHLRVRSSPRFADREARVHLRLENLLSAFQGNDWEKAYQVTWDEFVDMHELFETSEPAFSYRKEGSFFVLKSCENLWQNKKDRPLVTMDAGANVHLLFRHDQVELAKEMNAIFRKSFSVITSFE